jgi:septal ring factor EnvC (AmiA/AmiB activator)
MMMVESPFVQSLQQRLQKTESELSRANILTVQLQKQCSQLENRLAVGSQNMIRMQKQSQQDKDVITELTARVKDARGELNRSEVKAEEVKVSPFLIFAFVG